MVNANFIAEVETLVLTAGHDAAKLQGLISIDVSREGDHITRMSAVFARGAVIDIDEEIFAKAQCLTGLRKKEGFPYITKQSHPGFQNRLSRGSNICPE